MPKGYVIDSKIAYRFGNLIDAMLTEAHRCDYLTLKVDDEQFSKEEWNKAYNMKKAFEKDPSCARYLKMATGQSVFRNPNFEIDYQGFLFSLPVKCKYDLWFGNIGWGADIKSTTATTQKQFEDACRYFDYDRQRAWYMDITGAKQDILIGISKVNNKIFQLPINHESDFYKSGKEKYQDWAFKYYCLFSDFKLVA